MHDYIFSQKNRNTSDNGVMKILSLRQIMVYLSAAVLLAVVFGAVPCAAADTSPAALPTESSNLVVFITSDAVGFIIVLLVLLIVLLILAIIYMISTLIPRFASEKKTAIHLSVSDTTKQQIDRLMEREGAANREEFVQKLITEELSCGKGTHTEQDFIQEVVAAYLGSHKSRERLRRFVAETLLDDDNDLTIENEEVR